MDFYVCHVPYNLQHFLFFSWGHSGEQICCFYGRKCCLQNLSDPFPSPCSCSFPHSVLLTHNSFHNHSSSREMYSEKIIFTHPLLFPYLQYSTDSPCRGCWEHQRLGGGSLATLGEYVNRKQTRFREFCSLSVVLCQRNQLIQQGCMQGPHR